MAGYHLNKGIFMTNKNEAYEEVNQAINRGREMYRVPQRLGDSHIKTYLDLFAHAEREYAHRGAFQCLGHTLSFSEFLQQADQFAAYLQAQSFLQKGDRVAIHLPNLLQYPIAAAGILKAGMIVVNTNPLYTSHEIEHQFNDAGVKLVVSLVSLSEELAEALPNTQVEQVLLTRVGDMLPFVQGMVTNFVLKYVRKQVPNVKVPKAIPFLKALKQGKKLPLQPVTVEPKDLAVLQYTGGTTGVAKGCMLTHESLLACMHQTKWIYHNVEWKTGHMKVVVPLPLYHIYAFDVSFTHGLLMGHESVLIPNPRDIDGFIKTLQKTTFHGLTGLNTLFNALMNHEGFSKIDFSQSKLTLSGGMPLSTSIAESWEKATGVAICEGYGLTESSGILTVNPPGKAQVGSVGVTFPDIQMRVVDSDDNDVGVNKPGELCFKSPSGMVGYWQRPEATAKTMLDGEWIRTGDVAEINEQGRISIVDRMKDMIIVSGFNVYPNEIEDVVMKHPDVIECAVIAGSDGLGGEIVRLFAVVSNPQLQEKTLRDFCREYLTAYKVPKKVQFIDDMPKSNVGKILRRELRDLYQE